MPVLFSFVKELNDENVALVKALRDRHGILGRGHDLLEHLGLRARALLRVGRALTAPGGTAHQNDDREEDYGSARHLGDEVVQEHDPSATCLLMKTEKMILSTYLIFGRDIEDGLWKIEFF